MFAVQEFGHRVRIATHKDYREFVSRYDLEFYPLGGDPKVCKLSSLPISSHNDHYDEIL